MGKNQTSFKKGKPPGPGRPKGRTVRAALRLYLEQIDPSLGTETRQDIAVRMLWENAQGDGGYLLDLLKWLEGSTPPSQSNAGSDDDDKPKGITIPSADPRFAPREDRRPAPKRDRKRKPAKGTRDLRARRHGQDVPDPGGDP